MATRKTTSKKPSSAGFSAEEKAAIRELARERKAALQGAEAEAEVLARIKEMPKSDRVIAQRIHDIVKEKAPVLAPKTWYGMPAYASEGNVVCFFQAASKFKSRYATLGFTDKANIDDGEMFPTYYAIHQLTAAVDKKIAALIKKAVSTTG